MNKNIITLFLSGLFITSYASNNYVVLIKKDDSKYQNHNQEVSEWITISTDCNVDIEDNQIYYGISFQQTETCNENQERTITKTITDEDGNKTTVTQKETRIKPLSSVVHDKVGTHLENSCENILTKNYSDKNGYYKLDRGSQKPNVYCDMNEGGYTFYLIPLNSMDNWNNINWDIGWTPSPGFGFSNYNDIENKCQSVAGLPTYTDYKSSSNHYWNVARDFLKNETNFFASHKTAGDGAGIALGLKYVNGTWKTFSNSATSLIPSDSSDSGDHCTGDRQVCGFWDARDNNPNYGYGAGPEDWSFSQTQAVLCGGKF